MILFLVCVFLSPHAAFIESYKHGKIVFQPDFEFGAKTDWPSIFYEDIFPQLICRGSGEIYVSHPKQNKILQLDSLGNVTRTFGKDGQGPGDLDSPGQLSILDDRFLVVQERLRISLFDLEGRFVKIIKTRFPPRQTVALQKGIIAYVADRYDVKKIQKSVRMIDSTSGRETELNSFRLNHENDRKYFFNAFADDVIIQRTGDGKLLVGHTSAAEVNIYSITGERENNIKLRMNPTITSPKLQEEFFEQFFRIIDRIGFSGYGDKIVNMRDRSKCFFPPYIPYYQDIKIDQGRRLLGIEALERIPREPLEAFPRDRRRPS